MTYFSSNPVLAKLSEMTTFIGHLHLNGDQIGGNERRTYL